MKFLRNRRKLSQDQLAEELKISRPKLNALESGATKNPSLPDIIAFADYFKMSVDTLLRINLAKLSELKIRELEAGNDVYVTGKQLRVLATTVNARNTENVELVPIKAKAGYLNNYHDPEYIGRLPKYSIPGLSDKRTYRVFPIKGDSMLPVQDGDYIVGEYVQDWTAIPKDFPCIVVIKGQDIVFKCVHAAGVNESGQITLSSFNTTYDPYQVNASDIAEVWRFAGHVGIKIPQPNTTLDSIMQEVKAIRRQLSGKK